MTGQQSTANGPGKRARRTVVGVGIATAVIGLAGCGPNISLVTAPWSESQAVIQSSVFGGRTITFDDPPVISVDNGRIQSVTVTGPKGKKVGGKLIDGGSAYQIDTSDLDFGTKYTVSATAVDLRGKETSTSDSFRTFVPDKTLTATTNLEKGQVYGVGMPIIVTFDQPVKNRAEIERRLEVTTDSQTPIEGSWHWDSDTSVTYRTKDYWPAHTKVTLNADIKGVNAGNDTYATENKREKFKIGDSFIMTQDSGSHQMIVKRNGKTIRTIPTSSGRPGHETRSGTQLVMSKEYHVVMDAATLGIPPGSPDYYRLDVYYAMRVSWSGEYIHSAPWSVGSQGYSNVSHGCINVSPDNAIWLFNTAHIGDPVVIKNTGVDEYDGNGWTMWNDSWNKWKAGSALKS